MKYNYKINEITRERATLFVEKYHYSPIMPKLTKHFLGIFFEKELKGVLTLGWGVKPLHTIQKLFPTQTTKDYFEIGKMCMSDDMPKNSESQMLSKIIKWLKKEKSQINFLYTLADGIMGKCGYVYQASNFYFGEAFRTSVYLMNNGEKMHPRTSANMLKDNVRYLKANGKWNTKKEKLSWFTKDYMNLHGIKLIDGFMFRYVYPLNRKAEKMLNTESTLSWSRKKEDFPKEVNLKWYDRTNGHSIQITRPNFTFEEQKFNRQKKETDNNAINLMQLF